MFYGVLVFWQILVPHLLRGYNKVYRQRPPGDDKDEMKQFIREHSKYEIQTKERIIL